MNSIRRCVTFALAALLIAAIANAATFTVTNTNDSGAGSLREAINSVVASHDSMNTIAFSIGSGPVTINPNFQFAYLTKPVIIDGTTQPGFAGVPIVEIDGKNVTGLGMVCLRILAGSSVIKGLVINNYTCGHNGLGSDAAISVGGNNNVIAGNYIGTDISGTYRKYNDEGIRIEDGSNNNLIGGSSASPMTRNLLSGNGRAVDVTAFGAPTTTGNVFKGNFVGGSATGSSVIGNYYGIYLDSTDQAQVGGLNPTDGNIFLGDVLGLVLVTASNTTVQGNRFGTTAITTPSSGGMAIGYGSNNLIGGTAPGAGNQFLNLAYSEGIYIQDTSKNVVQGNTILNCGAGIHVAAINEPGGYQSEMIGGTAEGAGNIIRGSLSNPLGAAVRVYGAVGVSILRNSISNSDGIAIDLNDDGVSANDPGDADGGANGTQNYPVITGVYSSGGATTITGTLNSKGSSSYRIELFANPSCDASGHGEAETYLGFTTVTTDTGGSAAFAVTLPAGLASTQVVTATATDSAGSTSELSACANVLGSSPGQFSLSSTSQSVTEANTNVTFTVVRGYGTTGSASVAYATTDGTATAGADYVATSGTLTFADGESSKTITIPILDDTVSEPTETFTLSLFNPTNGATLGAATAIVSIIDNDAKPALTADDIRVAEGNAGTTQAIITLHAAQPVSGTVSYATLDGTAIAPGDYIAATGSVTFNNETQKQIAISIVGDNLVETDETFKVHLASSDFTIAHPDVAVTILNDDAGITPSSLTIAKGNSGSIFADIGTPATSTQTLTIAASDPCIKVPSSIDIGAGLHATQITVAAISAPCTARVDITFPPNAGNRTLSATVKTYVPTSVNFDPPSPRVQVGHTVPVHVTISPLDTPVVLGLQAMGGTVTVPATVTVDATGGGHFDVTGVSAGALTINVILPAQIGGGTAVLSGTVDDAPRVASISTVSPATGPVSGGTNVAIGGANLTANCAASFGGAPAATTFVSGASLAAVTPAHAAGTVVVKVVCGNDVSVLPNAFTYVAATPEIHVVAPSFGSVAGGTTVHINGRNIQPGCWAFFDNLAAKAVTVINDVEMTANTPAHAEGTVPVAIRCTGTPDAVLADGFTYSPANDPAPVITSIDPLSAAPGDTVTITGARLRNSDTISFDTKSAVIRSSTPEQAVVVVPVMPAGKVSINVTDKAGRVSTTGPIFTVLAPKPSVTSISPTSAPAGAELTIDGSGFCDPYKSAIGGTTATTVAMSYNRTVVRIPKLDPGTHQVAVVDAAGVVAANGGNLTVTPTGILINGGLSTCSTTDGGTNMTLTGSGFAPGATVTVGGVTAMNLTIVDSAHITLTTPMLSPGFATIVVKNPSGESATWTNAVRVYSVFDPDGCGVTPRGRPAHH